MDETRYLLDGQMVHVHQKLAGGNWLVEPYVEIPGWNGDSEQVPSGNMITVGQVYKRPPTKVVDKRVVEAGERLAEVNQRRHEVQREIRVEEDKLKEWQEKCAKYAGLESLFDFIEGKVTHYVLEPEYRWRAPKILTFEETTMEYGDDHRLLSLFGGSKGNLHYKLNRYRDDSGDWDTVTPCMSYEEAVERLTVAIKSKMEENLTEELIKLAEKHGISVEDEYRERLKEEERKSLQEKIAGKKAKCEELEKELAALEEVKNG